jgi:nitrate/TMAO reductase-like tetraheme cytochrome c subunit
VLAAGNLPSLDSRRVACCRADEAACPSSELCQAGKEDKPLKLPPGWKADDPLPVEKTNCVRCHLTAGRELTTPVREFARSVHDLAQLSCNSCHGGNTKDDATAHEDKFGFIGTKISAHIATCNSCHDREAQQFKKSKHWWDLSKKINRNYPTCVDCHGNHDVGRPPAEFSMTNVCTDCHKQFAKDFPHAAGVVTENDALWKVLREVQTKNKKLSDPIPERFRKEVNGCRAATARLMHRGQPITAKEAEELNRRVKQLRGDLETWLKEQK